MCFLVSLARGEFCTNGSAFVRRILCTFFSTYLAVSTFCGVSTAPFLLVFSAMIDPLDGSEALNSGRKVGPSKLGVEWVALLKSFSLVLFDVPFPEAEAGDLCLCLFLGLQAFGNVCVSVKYVCISASATGSQWPTTNWDWLHLQILEGGIQTRSGRRACVCVHACKLVMDIAQWCPPLASALTLCREVNPRPPTLRNGRVRCAFCVMQTSSSLFISAGEVIVHFLLWCFLICTAF
eukprot:RCo054965